MPDLAEVTIRKGILMSLNPTDYISIITLVISACLTCVTMLLSSRISRNLESCLVTQNGVNEKGKSYLDIDSLYLEVLKLGIEYPEFRDPSLTRNYKTKFVGASCRRYECYAYIVWNVCETVHDRCLDDNTLFSTWEPIMIAENKLHRPWFDNKENQDKFKVTFMRYIQNNPKFPA
jgi:hypothetical protein